MNEPIVTSLDGLTGPRAVVTVSNEDATRVGLLDPKGGGVAELAVTSDLSPSLSLFDESHDLRASLVLWRDGSPEWRFLGDEGKVVWSAP